MATINGCNFPEDLFYDVEENVWGRLEPDGTLVMGMTDVAQTKAGQILHVKPKKLGTVLERKKSAATVESGKWVGPVPVLFTGEVVGHNEVLKEQPIMVNKEPYGAGWVVRIRPTRLEEERGQVLYGTAAVKAYGEKVQAENFICFKCAK